MTDYIPVAGTHGLKRAGEWVNAHSLFDQYLTSRGFTRRCAEFGFWSTALTGTFFSPDHLAWQFGGQQLRAFLQTVPYESRNIIAHSHGGQVAAYAASLLPAIQIRSLITVDAPVRRDMDPVWEEARKHVVFHIHLYGHGVGNAVRWLGQRGRFRRQMPWADWNIRIKGGHSGILREAKHLGQLDSVLNRIRVDGT